MSDERPWQQARMGPGQSPNERWLEQQGQALRARRLTGAGQVAPQERLTEIFWLVSRSMRTTGDLAAARHRDPSFLECARTIAGNLGLLAAMMAFDGSEAALERRFFDVFDAICDELHQLPVTIQAD